jgi:hypothetical protein
VDDLGPVLGAGYKRRSTFIHRGHLVNPGASWLDAVRVACLTERIIYALRGGENEWISPQAYWRWQSMPLDLPDAG